LLTFNRVDHVEFNFVASVYRGLNSCVSVMSTVFSYYIET